MSAHEITHRRCDPRSIGRSKTTLAPGRVDELDLPEAQPIIQRIAANVCEFSTVDRAEHVALVARVALRAKRHPSSIFARPTLPKRGGQL